MCDQAAALLKNEVQDHIWEDLQTLKAKSCAAAILDTTLQAWSQGVVGERSFQQLTEDFADVMIPRSGTTRAAKWRGWRRALSISPKKVRRVAGAAGAARRNGCGG
jgi:hypothetical protein